MFFPRLFAVHFALSSSTDCTHVLCQLTFISIVHVGRPKIGRIDGLYNTGKKRKNTMKIRLANLEEEVFVRYSFAPCKNGLFTSM